MRGGLIFWTKAKLQALEEGIMIAEANNGKIVSWTEITGPGGRFAPTNDHEWPIADARETAAKVAEDMANNPTPEFGENKEGREP